MKKRLLLIISIIIAAALLFSGWTFIRRSQKESAYSTVTLAKTSITDSVLASGTVLSSNSKEIYSELSNYTLKEVLVKTGDRVKAGDVLAILDTDTLESDIRQAELNISNAETTLKNDIATIETNLKNAENSVKSAKIDLENAQQDYNEAKDLYLSAASTLDELEQKEDLLDKAQLSYDNAVTSLNSSRSKTAAISKTNIELQKVALEKLKKNLNKTRITAPIDGTVTLCNAEAGKSSTGLLFIVEDTDHLIVSTSVGEYDINLLKLGQQVVIKSDSTGNMEFAGVISEIAPSAQRDASGNLSASNVLFDTEVTLNSNDSNMKIGMNVRLTIILNEKDNVFVVPYDAVTADQDGNKWIRILETGEEESRSTETIKNIKVTTGIETDLNIEIEAAELKEGMKVVTDATGGSASGREV